MNRRSKDFKWLALVLCVVLAALALASCGGGSSDGGSAAGAEAASGEGGGGSADAAGGGEIKVGVLFSTSGALTITEEPAKNAALMAIEEINAAGGVNGKTLVPVYEDYGSDPALAVDKIKKLIMEDEVVATVGLYTSASRIACRPVLEENDGLLFYPTFYEGEDPSPNIVYTGACPNQQGDLFVPWLVENVGPKFFLLGTDTVYMQLINSQAKELLAANGGEVVAEEYVPSGHSDFATIINKINETKPDVIYLNLNGDSAVAFYKAYKQYGLDSSVMPTASFCSDENTFGALGPEISAGHMISINYFNTIDTPENQKFVEDYAAAYGSDSVLQSVAEASYKSVYLLKYALEEIGDGEVTPESIRAALADVEIDAPGGAVKVDSDNYHLYLKARIGKVNADGLLETVYESEELIKPEPV
ncbi:MAG: transporter substrate-binding domain-containing protein [Clostridiales Family XIII bacterium]|jgi:branched-chain amino acid transport system substrate-binding protein/urea transport system substrate-binding protein|nr:transporter substrate-binding domain-containing protein [Clostridiales Family XIII bacterium]